MHSYIDHGAFISPGEPVWSFIAGSRGVINKLPVPDVPLLIQMFRG